MMCYLINMSMHACTHSDTSTHTHTHIHIHTCRHTQTHTHGPTPPDEAIRRPVHDCRPAILSRNDGTRDTHVKGQEEPSQPPGSDDKTTCADQKPDCRAEPGSCTISRFIYRAQWVRPTVRSDSTYPATCANHPNALSDCLA